MKNFFTLANLFGPLCLSIGLLACVPTKKNGVSAPTTPIAPAAPSEEGTVGGGGGDLTVSTVEQVEESILKQRELLKKAFFRVQLFTKPTRSSRRPYGEAIPADVQKILNSMMDGNLKNSMPVLEFLTQVEFQIEKEKPCVALDEKHHDGSAIGSKIICLSVPRLQRIAKENLDLNILALAAHELSHLYGFEEGDAVKVQQFFITNSSLTLPTTLALNELTAFAFEWGKITQLIREHLANDVSDTQLCSAFAMLNQKMIGFSQKYVDSRSALWISPDIEFAYAKTTRDYFYPSLNYCSDDQDKKKDEKTKAHDRAHFVGIFKEMTSSIVDLRTSVLQFTQTTDAGTEKNFSEATDDLYAPALTRYYSSDRKFWPKPIDDAEVTCSHADMTLNEVFNDRVLRNTWPISKIHQSENGKIYLALDKSGTLRMGFRGITINNRQMGLQLMMNIKGGSLPNADIKIHYLENAVAFETFQEDQIVQLPTALLMKGINEEFQIEFSTSKTAEPSAKRDYFIFKCKIQKWIGSPPMDGARPGDPMALPLVKKSKFPLN
jgi:hypothetical protein